MEQQLKNLLSQIYAEPAHFQPTDSQPLNADDFRMYVYKILPCTRRGPHSWVECSYCHPGEKAARRCPQKYSYVPITCPTMKKDGQCPHGDNCMYAHNVFEYWLHPARYRTQLCSYGMECKRGICFFAHHPRDVRVHEHSAQLAALENQLQANDPSYSAPGAQGASQQTGRHQADAKVQQHRHMPMQHPSDMYQAEHVRQMQQAMQAQANTPKKGTFDRYQSMSTQMPAHASAAAAAAALLEAALQPPTPPVGLSMAGHPSLSPCHSLSRPMNSLSPQHEDSMAATTRFLAELSAAGKSTAPGMQENLRLQSVSSMPTMQQQHMQQQQHFLQQQQQAADGGSDVQQALQLIAQLQQLAGKASGQGGSLQSLLQNTLPQLLMQIGGAGGSPSMHMGGGGSSMLHPCASAPMPMLPIQAPRSNTTMNSPPGMSKGFGTLSTSPSPADALSIHSRHTGNSSSCSETGSHSPALSHHSDEGLRSHGSLFSMTPAGGHGSFLAPSKRVSVDSVGSAGRQHLDRDHDGLPLSLEHDVDLVSGMSEMMSSLSVLVDGPCANDQVVHPMGRRQLEVGV